MHLLGQNEGKLSWSRHQIVVLFLTALRIHVSPDTSAVLQQFGTFDLELRGAVEMKVNSKGFVLYINNMLAWQSITLLTKYDGLKLSPCQNAKLSVKFVIESSSKDWCKMH